MRVHGELGPGLLESAYCECLRHELNRARLLFKRELAIPVRYAEISLDCGFRADLVIEESILIELKAIDAVLPVHEAQLLTYLKLSRLKVGLLINFNVRRLKDGIRRFVI